MSDESKAGIVSFIWIGALAALAIETCVITAIILVFVTIIEAMYCKHDYVKEQLEKQNKRNRDIASGILHRELEKNSLSEEERYMSIVGEWK